MTPKLVFKRKNLPHNGFIQTPALEICTKRRHEQQYDLIKEMQSSESILNSFENTLLNFCQCNNPRNNRLKTETPFHIIKAADNWAKKLSRHTTMGTVQRMKCYND